MGSRGPVPKRSDQRRRRNRSEPTEKVRAGAAAKRDRLEPPPRTGRGSSTDAWRSYAEALGHQVPTDAKRGDIIAMVDAGPPEPAGADKWHPIAADWYRSLETSGQAVFFQPSDWAAARYVAEVMSRNLRAGRFSAQLFAACWSAMGELLTTEGARRRVRIEVKAETSEPDEDASVTAIADYRRALTAG